HGFSGASPRRPAPPRACRSPRACRADGERHERRRRHLHQRTGYLPCASLGLAAVNRRPTDILRPVHRIEEVLQRPELRRILTENYHIDTLQQRLMDIIERENDRCKALRRLEARIFADLEETCEQTTNAGLAPLLSRRIEDVMDEDTLALLDNI